VVLLGFGPFALSVVKGYRVVYTLGVHTSNVVQRAFRSLIAHLSHRGVEFEAALLHSASLQVNHAHLVTHNVAISSTDNSDL